MRLPSLKTSLAAFLFGALLAGPVSAATCGNDASGFDAWLTDYKAEAVALGIQPSVVEAALNGVTYNPEVIRLDRNQKVFKQSFEQFSGRMIPPRLKKARSMLNQHADLFARIEAQYGVPKEMVVTLWALETDFGAVRGNLSTIRALATLAYDCRRSPFFTEQLTAALAVMQRGDLSANEMRGGWAGELGQTQFLPTSYIKFAVDYDGDGRRDLLRSTSDVLGSTANYLRSHGWQTGQPWGEGTANFGVIQQWNKSSVYSRTIAEMARQLAEG